MKKCGKGIMKLLKFELIEMQEACQRKSSQLISTGFITKEISRMCSDKADRSSAIVIEILYSTCIWETGTSKVFDLIGDITSLPGRRAKLTVCT